LHTPVQHFGARSRVGNGGRLLHWFERAFAPILPVPHESRRAKQEAQHRTRFGRGQMFPRFPSAPAQIERRPDFLKQVVGLIPRHAHQQPAHHGTPVEIEQRAEGILHGKFPGLPRPQASCSSWNEQAYPAVRGVSISQSMIAV
jgi:hypothetical protein